MKQFFIMLAATMILLPSVSSCKKDNTHPASLEGSWVKANSSTGITWILYVSNSPIQDPIPGTFCTLTEKRGSEELSSYTGSLNYDSSNGSGNISFGSDLGSPVGKITDATDDAILLIVTLGSTQVQDIVQGTFTKAPKQ